MARIEPLDRTEIAQHDEGLALVEAMMGFVPNSMPTMARVPGLLEGFQGLGRAVLMNDLIPPGLKQMIAMMTSAGSGCRYCQAHTSSNAARFGIPEEKLSAIWEFETSDHFDDAERAALRVAFGAGQSPNQVSDADFATLKAHWSDDQATAIVAVISMFGFLNRWNDTMATTLEPEPIEFAERVLAGGGWEPGKHAE
jgi:AhpD family alkylhydroperoxidase